MTDDEQPQPTRYSYKPSIAGSPQTFELTSHGLSFTSQYRSTVWPYADIARIRMTYRPVSMLAHRFRADIRHKDGKRLTLVSATWAGLIALASQGESYRTFMQELHQRLASEGRPVVCLAGLPRVTFVLAAIVLAALMLALAILCVRALLTGQHVAALFMLGFAAWSGWTMGSWLMRNKPEQYAPTDVPERVLP